MLPNRKKGFGGHRKRRKEKIIFQLNVKIITAF